MVSAAGVTASHSKVVHSLSSLLWHEPQNSLDPRMIVSEPESSLNTVLCRSIQTGSTQKVEELLAV